MITETQQLVSEIEAVADLLGISASTVGERAGQGGQFYARLKAGKRAWPETIQTVRHRLAAMQNEVSDNAPKSGCEISHDGAKAVIQAAPAKKTRGAA